jgi:hypothetical protein
MEQNKEVSLDNQFSFLDGFTKSIGSGSIFEIADARFRATLTILFAFLITGGI